MTKTYFDLDAAKSKKDFKPLFAAINRSTVLPILADVLVLKEGANISFRSTDLENTVILNYPANGSADFGVTIDGSGLKSFIANSIANDIRFNVHADVQKAEAVSGGFKVKMPIQNKDNYPKTAEVGIEKQITINANELSALFTHALKFVSKDDLRPSMTGIYIHDRNGELYVVSTDAHRLFYKSLCKTPAAFKDIEFILPAKAARLFLQTFGKEEVTISVGTHYASFKSSDKEIVARLIDSKYPKYEVVLVKHSLKISFLRKQLVAFLKLAMPFSQSITRQIKLKVDQNQVNVVGGDMDYDLGFDFSLPLYNPSEEIKNPFKCGVNCNFLMQALSVNAKDEYVVMEHSQESTKAMVIDECLLLMPIMIND